MNYLSISKNGMKERNGIRSLERNSTLFNFSLRIFLPPLLFYFYVIVNLIQISNSLKNKNKTYFGKYFHFFVKLSKTRCSVLLEWLADPVLIESLLLRRKSWIADKGLVPLIRFPLPLKEQLGFEPIVNLR